MSFINVKVSLDFPKVPPSVKFLSHVLEYDKVKRMCNDDGTINTKYLQKIEWDPKRMGIGEYLMQVYNAIRSR